MSGIDPRDLDRFDEKEDRRRQKRKKKRLERNNYPK